MSGLVAAVLGLAVVDSINPSAIAATLYLLTGKQYVTRVLTYVFAVFLAYFCIGTMLMLGLDVLSSGLGEVLYSPIAYGVQIVIGAVMMLYGILAPSQKETEPRVPRSRSLGAVFLLGLTVSVIEFSTALPYFGAVGLMTNAGLSFAQWFPLLLVYNLILVAPPLLLLGLYTVLGSRLDQRFEGFRKRAHRSSRSVFLTLLAIIGFLLIADGLRFFAQAAGWVPDFTQGS